MPEVYDALRPICDLLLSPGELNFDQHERKLWMLAINMLVAEGQHDVAKARIGALRNHFPPSQTLDNLAMTLSRMPEAVDDAAFAGFRDDLTAEVQVIPRAGASTVLLGFGGARGKMGIPINLLHRWFGEAGVHVIYLRDMTAKLFMRGLGSIAPDYPQTIAALRKTIDDLGAERIVCQGNSGGGFGALRLGLDLGAERILVFGAQSHPFLNTDKRTFFLLRRFGVEEAMDLRPLYESAENPPKVRMVYAADHDIDALQAKNMDGLPGVTLEPMLNDGNHGVFVPLLESGRYDELLRELVTGEPAPPIAR